MSTNLQRVDVIVQGIESPDPIIIARCEVARTVAQKLDEALNDSAPQSQTAVATLSKEMRSALDDLSSIETKKVQLVASIFNDEE